MRISVIKSVLGITLAVALSTGLGFAHSWFGSHQSSMKSMSITIASPSILGNGSLLPPGTYRIEVPENSQNPQVSFYNEEGKLVAKATAKVVTEQHKNPYTEVDSHKQGNEQVISEVRPSGWEERLVFSQ